MYVVAARPQADAGLHLDAGNAHVDGVAGVQPIDRASVGLAELVSIQGIVEEVSEIVEQVSDERIT